MIKLVNTTTKIHGQTSEPTLPVHKWPVPLLPRHRKLDCRGFHITTRRPISRKTYRFFRPLIEKKTSSSIYSRGSLKLHTGFLNCVLCELYAYWNHVFCINEKSLNRRIQPYYTAPPLPQIDLLSFKNKATILRTAEHWILINCKVQ